MHLPLPSALRTHHALGIISALVFLVGGVAIADIISGLSTTNSSSNVTITNLPLNKPADVAVGDFMLASVAIHDGNAVVVTPPTGWTQILRTDNETNVSVVTYWKAVGASEPSSYLWTLSPQTRAQGGITRYSGVDPANPIDVVAGNGGLGTIATTSSVTTSVANEIVVAVYALHVGGLNHAGDFFGAPLGMTERYDASYTAAGPTIAEFDGVQTVPGNTGIKTSDIAGNKQRDWVSQIIAFRPDVPETLSDGLIHYWKLDEVSGDSFDSVGSMTMTNMNSTPYVPGKLNNGGDFERSNSNSLASSAIFSPTPLTAYTACFWFKPESVPDGGAAYNMFTSFTGAGGLDALYVNYGNGSIGVLFRHSSEFSGEVFHEITLANGTFYHLCGTWDGSIVRMYLNDQQVGQIANNQIGNFSEIGITAIGSQWNGQNLSDGVIDEVGVWNRALSASEISQLYSSGQGISYPF